MALVALAALKFILYYLVCAQAPRLLGIAPSDKTTFALSWAAARMSMGLVLAYPAFLLVTVSQARGLPFEASYAVVLLAARALLWLATYQAIASRHPAALKTKPGKWVALGVVASFAIDGAAFMAGADNFKFFC
jgi:hypothetical protein